MHEPTHEELMYEDQAMVVALQRAEEEEEVRLEHSSGAEEDENEEGEGPEPAPKRHRGEDEEGEKGGDPEDGAAVASSAGGSPSHGNAPKPKVPKWTTAIEEGGYLAYGDAQLVIGIFTEAHPLTRRCAQLLSRFISTGDVWYGCPSAEVEIACGVRGVWQSFSVADSMKSHMCKWARDVLQLPAIKECLSRSSDKAAFGKCMSYFNKVPTMSQHVELLKGHQFTHLIDYGFEWKLDQNSSLTCFADGMVFDLRTFAPARQAQPEDLISKPLGVSWSAVQAVTDAQVDYLVDVILKPIFRNANEDPDDETLFSVLDILSLAVFGFARLIEKMFLLHGSGRNGKSTLMGLIKALLGPKSFLTLDHSQLTSKTKAEDEKNPYLSKTRGARMVAMHEPSKGTQLQWDLMKKLSSNDPIQARCLHQGTVADSTDSMSFQRTFWNFILSNYLLPISGLGSAAEARASIESRMLVIKFPNNFENRELPNFTEPPNPNPVSATGFIENNKAVLMKVLLNRMAEMRGRSEDDGGPRIGPDGGLVGGSLRRSDLSDSIQHATTEYIDELFKNGDGSTCPLNEFEMSAFKAQLSAISNLEDMRNDPVTLNSPIPDHSFTGAWKERIFGRANPMINESAILKKSSNNRADRAKWYEITAEGYELIMAECGLKKKQNVSGARDGNGGRGRTMSFWYKQYEGSDQKYWLVYRAPM